jgi:RNA polymerase-interacting CarD/CdnL/TRCF family regulator
MFNVGDYVIYSANGFCLIDDICKKNFGGETKNYYTLHLLEGKKLNKQDEQLLTLVQNLLFSELALSLDITFEEVNEMVSAMIKENCKGC